MDSKKFFAQPDQHFYALVLKPSLYYHGTKIIVLTGSSSREEVNRSETFEPKSANRTVA